MPRTVHSVVMHVSFAVALVVFTCLVAVRWNIATTEVSRWGEYTRKTLGDGKLPWLFAGITVLYAVASLASYSSRYETTRLDRVMVTFVRIACVVIAWVLLWRLPS